MLTRIALVAPSGHTQKKLRTLLSRPLAYIVREFQNMEEVQMGLSQFSFQVLIVRVPAFELGHVHMIAKLRAAYPHAGLITVSPHIDPQARFQLRQISRHTLLDEELEMDDFYRIIKRSAEAKHAVAPRLHPRTKREGHAVLVVQNEDDTEIQVRAKFLDFARMGARVLLEADEHLNLKLKPKSRIELRYRSSEDQEKIHRIETRVVWAEDAANPLDHILKKTKAEIGLRFVAEL
jgi:DNA-binding NarL/FixJ family response regulator